VIFLQEKTNPSIFSATEADLLQLIAHIIDPHSPATREDVEFGLAAFGVKEKDRSILAEKWCQDD
jgi:hypothetical protein